MEKEATSRKGFTAFYEQSRVQVTKAKDAVFSTLDQNGDGQLGIDDIIIAAVKTPGVRIDREVFLRKELSAHCPEETVEDAIAFNPAYAGISQEILDKIAGDVITFERNCVSGISAALSAPGGWAMMATIPADLVQYYAYTLRATQKLLYLYGFPEITVGEDGVSLDTGTMNTIILCLGVMNGVAGANNAVKAMARALAVGVEKQLMKKALTKGVVYPIVKQVAKWFGVRMTKSLFTGAIKKAIPVVGGVIGGGITFLAFGPCCHKLQETLKDTQLSNPDHQETETEREIFEGIMQEEVVDVPFEEVETPEDDGFLDKLNLKEDKLK